MADDPFYVAVDTWVAKAKERQDRVIQLTAMLALQRIKDLTPVVTGNLRANWTVVVGNKTEALTGQPPRPEQSEEAILSLHAGSAFTLVNPTIYAARVCYGYTGTDKLGRHYDQPGVHMVEKVASEMPDIVAKAIAIVAAGG